MLLAMLPKRRIDFVVSTKSPQMRHTLLVDGAESSTGRRKPNASHTVTMRMVVVQVGVAPADDVLHEKHLERERNEAKDETNAIVTEAGEFERH